MKGSINTARERLKRNRDRLKRNKNYNGRASCPPFVYLTSPHVIKSPRLHPPYLHTVSNQILEVETAWERGYIHDTIFVTTMKVMSSCTPGGCKSAGKEMPVSFPNADRDRVKNGHELHPEYTVHLP